MVIIDKYGNVATVGYIKISGKNIEWRRGSNNKDTYSSTKEIAIGLSSNNQPSRTSFESKQLEENKGISFNVFYSYSNPITNEKTPDLYMMTCNYSYSEREKVYRLIEE